MSFARVSFLFLATCLVSAQMEVGAGRPPAASESKPDPNDGAKKATSIVDRSTGFALQGDAAQAVNLLKEAPGTIFFGENAQFRDCMLDRFGSAAGQPLKLDVTDSWISKLARNYVAYWQVALAAPTQREGAENDLRMQTSWLLNRPLPTDKDLDDAEDQIIAEALKRGYHVLLGRTQPLRELMLWKKLTVEQREVQLPEGSQRVTVNLLDDFVLRGWGYYATCSRRSAGGWATDKALFAVVPAYESLTDETFSVRFLAHESQHFADKNAFPNLESWELEYRAKLVELALADQSQSSTLQLICENRGESKDSPHGYANFQVVAHVAKQLGMTTAELCESISAAAPTIREAAKAVLVEDSKQRGKKLSSAQ